MPYLVIETRPSRKCHRKHTSIYRFIKFTIKVSICNECSKDATNKANLKRIRLSIWAKLNGAMTMDRSSKKNMNKTTIYISVCFMRLTLLSLVWSLILLLCMLFSLYFVKIDRVIELMNSNNNGALQTNKINEKNRYKIEN